MGPLHVAECRDCDFEKQMIGDEFAQRMAERHQAATRHRVTVRNTSTGQTFVTPREEV